MAQWIPAFAGTTIARIVARICAAIIAAGTKRGEPYDLALRHRHHCAARPHIGGRGWTASAAERPARSRALPLRAVAARPLHAAEAAGQAAAAVGLRAARRLEGKSAAAPDLLTAHEGASYSYLTAIRS